MDNFLDYLEINISSENISEKNYIISSSPGSGKTEFAINYLKELVPVEFVIKTLKREEHPEYPEDAYREAIVNAVVHRDYFKGDEVAVEKLKSSIIINNKGGLMFDKQEFGKKSEHRNRLIVDLLARTDFMEKVGTGIKRIQDACFKNSNNVEFNFNEDFFNGSNVKSVMPSET